MRLSRTRTISQAFFLALFLLLLMAADFRWIRGYPVQLFLWVDPLLAMTTTLASWTLYGGLILSLAVLISTVFLGRWFCGWMCPLGAINEFFSWIFGPRDAKARIEANRYRRPFAVKYYLLAVFLVLGVFGVTQVGLIDPISLLTRGLSTSVLPAVGLVTRWGVFPARLFQYGWVAGGMLLAIVMLNALVPRLFCRMLCPLGALLGVVSRLSLFHVYRSEDKCIHCSRCVSGCQGACEPDAALRKAECFVCMYCRQVCPTDAIEFRTVPPTDTVRPQPDVSRRRLVGAGVLAAVGAPLLRASAGTANLPSPSVIRPPGAEAEKTFLAKCIKCGECMKVCPTNVIQGALFEAGIEGFWTPLMVYRLGYCDYNCNLCAKVCPTGALREFTLAEKHGEGEKGKPIKLGTAFVDRGRCLPWAMNTPCIVCEEMCPVSPKAIVPEHVEVKRPSGEMVVLQRPVVDPTRCIGCGACEYNCPVHDRRAIRVTSVGESRSDRNVLVLGQ